MKKYLFFAASALAVVSCSNDDYLGNNDGNNQGTNSAILFDGGTSKTTRATTGATNTYTTTSLQTNGFWVYGYKTKTGSTDQVVYQNYYLNYIANSENQSQTNTKGWEYVGVNNSAYATAVTPHLDGDQTIKYWDYSANSYKFFAATANPQDLKDGKVAIKMNDTKNQYTVTLKEGADLSSLYFADKVGINTKNTTVNREAENEIGGLVKFQFRNALTKVRVAVFETIPGYSVKVDKFYYTNEGTETADGIKFAADVTNTKLDLNEAGVDYQVTFNADGQAVLQPNTDGEGSTKSYITLGKNIQAQDKLGEDALHATYDNAGGAYTWFIAQPNNTSNLKLKVDYTLTSDDNSGEEIKVTGATAVIPADLLKWKNNYAYTYIFKITDQTNGGTGGTTDPKGLYPITFDAAVIETGDGIQETITTVSDPSITTYGKGAVDNEYKANTNIYVSVANSVDGGAIDLSTTNTKLYVVDVATNVDVTEAYVAHCLSAIETTEDDTNSDGTIDTWTLQETVGTTTNILKQTTIDAPEMTAETPIPESDVQGGGAISGKFMKFTPTAKGTYVFEYTEGSGDDAKKYYKVIKVVK